ncbi:MAG: hypothetical protein K9N05_04635 [Candidatus Marinimicrobia bacterium]|nr:hypothetical protein [Candidatus Neomarinimicrobiota bacterium]
MKKNKHVFLIVLLSLSGLFGMDKVFEKGFDLFYNYHFNEAGAYFKEQIEDSNDPFPYYAFLSYLNIRSDMSNARYEDAMENADKMIRIYSPVFESYLQNNPDDVNAQFYYTVLLAGKMRIYLNKMEYLSIIKEAPKILSKKVIIDRYKNDDFTEMEFGTGAFDYYLSVIGGNYGMSGIFSNSKSDGIRDLWSAYDKAEYTRWEAAIVLMYVYLYDKMDYEQCDQLCDEFLAKFPENLEVLAIAAECAYYQAKWNVGDTHKRQINKLLKQGLLDDDRGWQARLNYVEGVRSMLKEDHVDALDHFNTVYEMDANEYSWYRSIVLKYTGDVYLKMGLVRTAKLYYEQTANSLEISPHVREAKDILKSLK